MHFVYVLRSEKDQNLYIGCTGDLNKRLIKHNKGQVPSTKHRRPFVLVYSEEFADKYTAFGTEAYYKTAKGKRDLKAKLELALSSNG